MRDVETPVNSAHFPTQGSRIQNSEDQFHTGGNDLHVVPGHDGAGLSEGANRTAPPILRKTEKAQSRGFFSSAQLKSLIAQPEPPFSKERKLDRESGHPENFDLGKSLNGVLLDGAMAAAMASLAGGLFLVGFALNVLHATPVQIGILAALPVSANVAQFLGALFLMRFGYRRWLCFSAVSVARILWLPILLIPFVIPNAGESPSSVWILIALVGISCMLGSVSGVAWLDWMSDIIPRERRGSFMAKRSGICAAAGSVAILAGGQFLTHWQASRGSDDPVAYVVLFALGLGLGLLASCFLWTVRDPKQGPPPASRQIDWTETIEPVKQPNFLFLLLYVGFFMFSTQIAAPFYSVYMLEELGVDFSLITWMMLAATLATLFMLRIWGPISDRCGSRPILLVAGALHALIPIVWIAASSKSLLLPLFAAHILSGAIYCAITLSHVNILMKLAPVRGRSMAIAFFNGVIGGATAIAPILGGWLVSSLGTGTVSLAGFALSPLEILFLVSGGLQILCLATIARVREEGAAPAGTVLLHLGNDLNPQNGIASASDLVILHGRKSKTALRRLDTASDAVASRSEAIFSKTLDSVYAPLRPPLRAIRKFLMEDLK